MSHAGSSDFRGLWGQRDPSGSSRSSVPSGHSGLSGSSRPSARSGPVALSGLSDRELLARVKALVSQERATTLEILVHLIEVERRKLHLGLGYPSLFEYCTRHLGYSNSAAGRRIHAARCIRDFPEVYYLLEKNEVNLSSVSLVASILTIENKADLLGRIRNRSQKEVEGVVADYRPPASFRDRVRPVCVAVAEPPQKTAGELRTTLPSYSRSGSEISPNVAAGSVAAGAARGQTGASTEKRAFLAAGDNAPTALCDLPPAHDSQDRLPVTNNTDAPSPRLIPRIERKLLVQFLASEAFMKKFEKTRALLSNKLGKPSYEAVLETALDEFLKHHDPENRKQRREGRRNEAKTKPTPKTLGTTPDSSRHIPEATRDAVFAKDKGRCTYVGSTGKRCDATHNLQIDHVVPFARGGSNAVGNVRLLCARHNKLEAERVYGANTMRRFGARERTLEQFRASE